MINILIAFGIVTLLVAFAAGLALLINIYWWVAFIFVFVVLTPIIYLTIKDVRG